MSGSNNDSNGRRLRNWAACAAALLLVWGGGMSRLHGQERTASPEDHSMIAERYRKEAVETRDTMKRHEISRDVYRRGTEPPYTVMNPQGRKRMVQHCDRLIEHYTKAAQELDAMAAEHEALANQPTHPGRS